MANVQLTSPPRISPPSRSGGMAEAGLGWRQVLAQVHHDLFGTKDVQDAVTASYTWLADQLGHVTLGFLPTLILCWVWMRPWLQRSEWMTWVRSDLPDWVGSAGFVAAALVVLAWWARKERADLVEARVRAAGSAFPLNSGDLNWNVKTALLYFGLGCAIACASYLSLKALIVLLLVAPWPGFRVANWWLRRKLAFQQAGLPFLYRLANFHGDIKDQDAALVMKLANLRNKAVSFWDVCFGNDPPCTLNASVRHLLITGPLASGKTSLAVGIGTEVAFALGVARYLTLAKLIQLNADPNTYSTSQMDYDDGRILWPWRACNLIIVDDVDAGVRTGSTERNLVQPSDFMKAIGSTQGGPPPLAWLGQRRSVWIIGDPSTAADWRANITRVLGIASEEMAIVQLTPSPALASNAHRLPQNRHA